MIPYCATQRQTYNLEFDERPPFRPKRIPMGPSDGGLTERGGLVKLCEHVVVANTPHYTY